MNIKSLTERSLLKTALSKEYAGYITFAVESCLLDKKCQRIMNIYTAYCYVTGKNNYTAIDILNNSNLFNKHFQLLIGFIYNLDHLAITNKYTICNLLRILFRYIAQNKQLRFDEVKLSNTNFTEAVLECLSLFKQLDIDNSKMNYLNGYQVVSKEGKRLEVNLDAFYVKFGTEFTSKVHHALNDYALKQKSSTLKSIIRLLKMMFGGMVTVYAGRSDLAIETLLSREHVQSFFHKVYKVLFIQSQISLNSPKHFHQAWNNAVQYYTDCFIYSGVFDKPNKPFIIPSWKDPKNKAPVFSIGGNTTSKEKYRWFTSIPLKIKDEEAITIIQQRLDRDMEHVRRVCLMKFDELLELEARNKVFIEIGLVKPLSNNSHNQEYYNIIGPDNISNIVATFYSHGIGAKNSYPSFLGINGNVKEFITELNLPTTSTLNVLLTLLVIEHPLITPSWLQKWELFDVNGNQVGYKKTSNQYIAVSYKSRKGSANAQQDVILNDFSKSIVEFLIEHTRIARNFLKNKGDVNWRKMILTASISNANFLESINGNLQAANVFYGWLQDKSLLDNNSYITIEDMQAISNIHSLRSIRRHRGLQIYLETRSMDAVAEVLGHEKKNVNLLTHYLPEPLMDFFNDRWMRQFQNAILLEAMKDSAYFFEVVNMSAEDIEEFLNNHGIAFISENFELGSPYLTKANIEDSEPGKFSQLTYTISTALLQLLMAIRVIVEDDDDEQDFLDIVYHWYQSAVFILNTLNSDKHSTDSDLMEMLDIATKNKLDTNLIVGALLC